MNQAFPLHVTCRASSNVSLIHAVSSWSGEHGGSAAEGLTKMHPNRHWRSVEQFACLLQATGLPLRSRKNCRGTYCWDVVICNKHSQGFQVAFWTVGRHSWTKAQSVCKEHQIDLQELSIYKSVPGVEDENELPVPEGAGFCHCSPCTPNSP